MKLAAPSAMPRPKMIPANACLLDAPLDRLRRPAAGGGGAVYDERVTGRVKFRRAWLARHGLAAQNCRVIHVIGESMEPTLVDGCSILVNHASRQRRIGHIYVVRTEDGLIVKRAGKDLSGVWQLVSDNPDTRTWPNRPLARGRRHRRRGQVDCADIRVRSDAMNPIVSGIDDARNPAGADQAAAPAAKARQPRRKPVSKAAAKAAPRRRVRVAEGIYQYRHGLAATVKVNGIQREIRFPPGTPLKTIRTRRDELRASLRTLPAGGRHTLNHDAGRYLDQVRSTLISFGDRRRELLAWLPRFGHLRTLALPAHLPTLNAQLHEWRRTLAASTCNHRRHALTNLVRVLYGRRASFDLLDLVRFAPPPPKPRWVDRRHIADVPAQLTPDSGTRVRLELMHWTGMRPSQMGRLRDEDFRLDEPIP